MDKKIKVLEISLVSHNSGGVEKFLADVFRYVDHGRFQIDFLSPDGGSYTPYMNEIIAKGGNILDLNIDRINPIDKIRYNLKLYRFFKKHDYDIVHINSGAFLFCLQVAAVAKMCGIKSVITHCHSNVDYSKTKSFIIHRLKPTLEDLSDKMAACSKVAAESIFTKTSVEDGKVVIIHNGIETEAIRFDEEKRTQVKQELDLNDSIVYGHVGRFAPEKNHRFLIDVFYEICKIQDSAKLLLVGEGDIKEDIVSMVKEKGLVDKVAFLGRRDDVKDILNAMDAFLMPSMWEGLPIAAIEAQANGLRVFCSSEVPAETGFTELFVQISLNKTAKEWAEIITGNVVETDPVRRIEYADIAEEKGFNIRKTAKEVTALYESVN